MDRQAKRSADAFAQGREGVTFGSLFTGIGGMDLGLERAGLRCVWQVEINEFCRRVLTKHWRHVRRHDDVRTFPPGGEWDCDLIAGGDPCQENSAARGYGDCEQSSLGGEFIRVVDVLRPRLVLRENPTHTRRDAPWPWWRFRTALESLGYAVLPFRLRACCLGLEHRRDRLFLLAELADANRNRLERRQEPSSERRDTEPARLVQAANRVDLLAARGMRSRAGLPDYVERMRAIGNAVCPQVAEWIGRRILAR